MPEKWVLKQLQCLPLIVKIRKTQIRIREWYEHFDGNVYISFSGGKDSTALAHLVHEIYPEIPLVFVNTGLEYPEIQSFARKMGAEFVRPKISFSEVISTYGYPIISKEVSEAIFYARKIRGGGANIPKPWTERRKKIAGTLTRNTSGLILPGNEHLKDSERQQSKNVMNSTGCAKILRGGVRNTKDLKPIEEECSPG